MSVVTRCCSCCDCSRTLVAAGCAVDDVVTGSAPPTAPLTAFSCLDARRPTMASTTSRDTTENITRMRSLPFDGGGRLARHVVSHPVDAAHLVDDAARYPLQQAVGQL